jgi:DNA-binding NarL/FixJ family response regulator
VQAAVQSEADEVLLAEATCGLGAAQVVAGNLGAGERNLATSAEMAARQGRPYREAWAKAIQAWSLTWRGRIREAKHLLATDPALNAALADIPPVGAVVAWYEGDLSGCVESVADLDRTNPGGLGPRRAWVGAIAALALAEMGRQPDARRFLERVESVYQGRDWYTHTRRNRWARGAVALLGGNAAEGLRSMREAYAAYRLMGVGSEIDVLLEDIAESAALMSDSAVSRWAADEITTIPIAGESPFTRALIDLAEAWASHAEQRFTESAIAADAALDYLRDSPYRLFAARSLDVRGRSSLAHDRPVAITFLKEAAAGYARCTATLRRTRVLDLLREAGSTGRRAALTGLGVQALTTREREVAELVVEGLTSREIGDRLRIGKRTVDTHVDHVLAKTGLRSRLELARKGSSLGLVD